MIDDEHVSFGAKVPLSVTCLQNEISFNSLLMVAMGFAGVLKHS